MVDIISEIEIADIDPGFLEKLSQNDEIELDEDVEFLPGGDLYDYADERNYQQAIDEWWEEDCNQANQMRMLQDKYGLN